MGVPKFFRYISERYPCLSQLVLQCDIPDFDNLYLDMNGIIHNCSHPNDYDPHFRITEEKIFKDIFNYIEALFRIIKPKKLFFMAVDGVAPRAKMNQQRGRRFRSAKETEDRDSEVLKKGGHLPDTQKFDSNCITPGTSFMAKLQAQLKFFVANKVSTDKMWQKVKVILSGHECPGEGEHKIMDYIRFLRSQPEYDSNTKHCLYGLDADLIMLGLCTHEPHFALLREEVKFGRKQTKKILTPEEIKFFLLHLSLLREYLEMEFASLKETLPFDFSVENIIDDWVLMCFLVGNDFIPNLPGMHINTGALSVLYKAYCEILPTLDGYLNEGGQLNLARFEVYMKKLASYDIKQFREQYDDLKYLKSKTSKNGYKVGKDEDIGFNSALQPYFGDDEDIVEEELGGMKRCVKILDDENAGTGSGGEDDSGDECVDMDKAVHDMMDLDESDGSDYYDEDDKEADRLAFFQEFCLHKKNYYQEKLEYKRMTPAVLRDQAEGYIKAIQWNLNYYYNGLCSWSWYYPHHYSPYISDIQNFKDMQIEFEPGKPFLPFEQLLAVLPSFSKDLLPKPFQELMIEQSSPILNYYPLEFRTDLNGKKNDWEAVVLIPFIDEERLLESMNACYDRLTDEEKERNKHGPMHVFTYSEEDLGRLESPAYFGVIEKNHALDTPLYREDIMVPREKLRKGLLEGALVGVYFPGFPTFRTLNYTSQLKEEGVKVFQSPSQGLNMIVQVEPLETEYTHEGVMDEFLNKTVHVNWPYLSEALVIGLLSASKETAVEGAISRTTDFDKQNKFTKETRSVTQDLMKSRGICAGTTNFLLKVRLFEGQKFTFGSQQSGDVSIHLEKKWGNSTRWVPLQMSIKDLQTPSKLNPEVTLDEIFPMNSYSFLLNPKHYGCLGFVNGKSEEGLVRMRITIPPEPESTDLRIYQSRIRYVSNYEAAKAVGIGNHLLARLTGTILVLDTNDPLMIDKAPKVNIGLNLKFSRRNQQLPGFTKRLENNQWLYSDRTIELLREYVDTFPDVVSFLGVMKNSDKDIIFKNDLFPLPEQSHMLKAISEWLESKPELKEERRSCDIQLLEPDQISDLEVKVEQFMKKNKRGRYVNLKVKPSHLYLPSSQIEKVKPDKADFRLLDRVVNVRNNFVVPLGQRGTIIGLEKTAEDSNTLQCDILFDQPFGAATSYHTRKKRVFRMPEQCLLNITHAKYKSSGGEASKTSQNVLKQPRTTIARNVAASSPFKVKVVANQSKVAASSPLNAKVFTNQSKNVKTSLPTSEPYTAPIPVSSFMNHFAHNPATSPASKPIPASATLHQSVVSCDELEAKSRPEHVPDVTNATEMKKEAVSTTKKTKSADSKEPTNTLKEILKITPTKSTTEVDPTQEVQMLTLAEVENKLMPRRLLVQTKSSRPKKQRRKRKMRNNAPKDYIIELQEIFVKLGQPSPHYDYDLCNGMYCATLTLPNIEVGVVGDMASSKKAAAERAAFIVLQFLGVVRKFGDRVVPTEVSGHSLRDIYKRIGHLKDRLSDLHRSQTVNATVQQQQQQQPQHPQPLGVPAPQVPRLLPPPPSLQQQQQQQQQQQVQYPPQVPRFLLGQNPILPQVSSVPVPAQTQASLTFNQNLIRPTPQFPPNAYANVYQPRTMNLAANYLFQQPLISQQSAYYQQASFRPPFNLNTPMNIPTSAAFAANNAPNANVPVSQFAAPLYLLNNANGMAVTAQANSMPRVRLQTSVGNQSQFGLSQTTPYVPTSVFNNGGMNSLGNVRPDGGFVKSGGVDGSAMMFSKAVGSSPVPRQPSVRPFYADRIGPMSLSTNVERQYETVASSPHHFNPIQQESLFMTVAPTGRSLETPTAITSSANSTRNVPDELSLFSSGRMSKTPRRNRLAANFATKPSV